MQIPTESILKAAGIAFEQGPTEVLRGGFPSYVLRVHSAAFPGRQTVIVKACPAESSEPDILLHLHESGLPVPAVLNIGKGDDFRVVVQEDIGPDALYKHPDTEFYCRAAQEIARIHSRFALSDGEVDLTGATDLASFVPKYDASTWTSIVSAAVERTLLRLEGGIYKGFDLSERRAISRSLNVLETKTRVTLERLRESSASATQAGGRGGIAKTHETRPCRELCALTPTLIHGDYHEGNVLIRPAQGGEVGQHVIVDWDSARFDSGFFDLVSLCDVADRMGTCRVKPAQVIDAYLGERCASDRLPSPEAIETEWRRCCILRAWAELRWFSETGEDFGDRVSREVEIIRWNLSRFG